METIGNNSPTSPEYELRPETAQVCLASSQREPHRKWAYANALCAFCLAISAVGFKQDPIEPKPVRPVEYLAPVPWEQTEADPAERPETAEAAAEAPGDSEAIVRPDVVDVAPAVLPSGPAVAETSWSPEAFKLVQPGPLPSRGPVAAREWHAGSREDSGSYPAPDYPRRAEREKMQGVVVLDIMVSETGLPERVTVRQTSGHALLDDYTVGWVKSRWRWPVGSKRYYFWSCAYTLAR
jgi:protein TonB